MTARFSTEVMPVGTATTKRGTDQLPGLQDLGQEILDHHAGDFKIGDYAVFERTNGDNPLPVTTDDVARLLADGDHLMGILIDGHHGRFVEDHPLASEVDEGIGRTEVHGQISAKETQQTLKHIRLFFPAVSSVFSYFSGRPKVYRGCRVRSIET